MFNFREKTNILVIGDLMIDHYLWGKCERISPEAPVQIVNIEKENSVLGGAGNVINNLRSLGSKVDVISVIGNDLVANELQFLLKDINVNSNMLIIEKNRKTSKKSRLIASQQQIIRYDNESIEDISINSEENIFNIFKKNLTNYDTVILSDYGKGVLTNSLTQKIISLSNKNNVKIFVDPKGKDYTKYKNAYALTPNKKEAIQATNIEIIDNDSLEKAIVQLKENCNLTVSLITLSESGIAIYDDKLRIKPTLFTYVLTKVLIIYACL